MNDNLNILKPAQKLSPFGRFCCTIGHLPSSYMVSLSYEEQLLWLCNYLEKTILPAINNNAEALLELQNLYAELKTYVDTYFDNLNVQTEINNKLDEMAESGELTEIIAQYLELAGLLCFNTKSDLKSAQNLVDGSFAKTFGTTTYNDGYGYFYKIRELLNTDVIDDNNIIALTNYEDLIAEKIIDNNIVSINNEISTLNQEVELIKNKSDLFNLKLQPNIIYDLSDDSFSQGSCVIDNILFVYVETSFPYGDIYKFNVVTGEYVGVIQNKKLYHGNDMCAIDNNIYVASCKNDAGQNLNKSIVILNPTTEAVTEINPFSDISKNYIFGIAQYDENNLLCALTDSESFTDLALYLYNISDETILNLSLTNTFDLPLNFYTSFQSIESIDNKIYIMTSLNDSLIELNVINNTANINKIYNLPALDDNNQIIGEYEGISKCSVFGENALIITSIITDNNYNNIKTIKAYVINPVNNLSDSNLIYPNIPYIESNEQRVIQYLKASSTSLFENGSSTYPYKSLTRALRAINNKKSLNNNDILITDDGDYYINTICNQNAIIRSETNTPSLYIKRIVNSNITITGVDNSNKIDLYLTDNTNGTRYDIINSKIYILFANIHLINRTWISASDLKLMYTVILKMAEFTSTTDHLWLSDNLCTIQDSSDYGAITNPWWRLVGDSTLFATGSSLPVDYATKVDKSTNSILILPGTFSNA